MKQAQVEFSLARYEENENVIVIMNKARNCYNASLDLREPVEIWKKYLGTTKMKLQAIKRWEYDLEIIMVN